MFYTYVIQSETSGIIYTGHTNNFKDRINRHNQNRNKFTAGKGPWELIFQKGFETRAEACRLEKKLKGFKNKEFLLAWIKQNSDLAHPDFQSGGP